MTHKVVTTNDVSVKVTVRYGTESREGMRRADRARRKGRGGKGGGRKKERRSMCRLHSQHQKAAHSHEAILGLPDDVNRTHTHSFRG